MQMKNLGAYRRYTIDEMIAILKAYKNIMGGETLVYLSDFEFNSKQTSFEFSKVEGEKELYLFYERHESEW